MTAVAEPVGSLSILNVGMGDVTLTFGTPDELEKGAKHIDAMLKQGYAILLKMSDGTHRRVKSIDEKTGEYVLIGSREDPPARGGARVPVREGRAVAVARSAGG